MAETTGGCNGVGGDGSLCSMALTCAVSGICSPQAIAGNEAWCCSAICASGFASMKLTVKVDDGNSWLGRPTVITSIHAPISAVGSMLPASTAPEVSLIARPCMQQSSGDT